MGGAEQAGRLRRRRRAGMLNVAGQPQKSGGCGKYWDPPRGYRLPMNSLWNLQPIEVMNDLRPFIHPDDAHRDYLLGWNHFAWYRGYASALKPKRILEIGCRRGYSCLAMLAGHPETNEIVACDNECFGCSLEEARANVKSFNPLVAFTACKIDTQRVAALPTEGRFELIH